MNAINTLLNTLWQQYTRINPYAEHIHKALIQHNEIIVNDHIAFRTFQHPDIGIDCFAKLFGKLGYIPKDSYTFTEKKLKAQYYQHTDSSLPKIFVSELELTKFSKELQKLCLSLIKQISIDSTKNINFLSSSTPWETISSEQYNMLRQESEYAAWLATWGFCANHFTILVNKLNSFKTLSELNDFIKKLNIPLNTEGGVIKGSAKTLLEQSSTRAAPISKTFSDKTMTIPSCYYEFAYRYPLKNGQLFHGFVTESADKIFESTDNL